MPVLFLESMSYLLYIDTSVIQFAWYCLYSTIFFFISYNVADIGQSDQNTGTVIIP